jgi:hypothetical protein
MYVCMYVSREQIGTGLQSVRVLRLIGLAPARVWVTSRPQAPQGPLTKAPGAALDRPHKPPTPRTVHNGFMKCPGPSTEAPRAAQDPSQRHQELPRTAHRGPKSGTGPPTYGPRAAQDRIQRPHKTANIGPKSGPGPPTWAPRAAQGLSQRPSGSPRPPTEARQLHDRSSIDNIEEEIQRQNMPTVNFRPDCIAICSLTISL